MSVAIRLSRFGRKDLPFYRVVVVDARKKRDGEFLETIGTYDGFKSRLVAFKPERYDAWVKQGAQPSATAKKLYRLFKKAGVVAVTSSRPASAVQVKEEAPRKVKKATTKELSVEKVKKDDEASLEELIAPKEEPKE